MQPQGSPIGQFGSFCLILVALVSLARGSGVGEDEGGVRRELVVGNREGREREGHRRALADSESLRRLFSYSEKLGGVETPTSLLGEVRGALNALVDESRYRTSSQTSNVVFLKTHKTGSTTLASVLYRYGARHAKPIAQCNSRGTSCALSRELEAVRSGVTARPEIFHYHVVWDGMLRGETWWSIKDKYQEIMSNASPVNYVTVMRDPVTHYISYFTYFLQPKLQISLEQYLTRWRRVMVNPMCAEFGIWGPVGLRRFINLAMSDFSLILLTEKFDEGLVVMARELNWDLIDITYSTMLETKEGAVRWDGRPLARGPKFEDLSQQAQRRLHQAVAMDKQLYDVSVKRYEAVKAQYGGDLDADVAEYERLQKAISSLLATDPSLEVKNWYSPETDDIFYKSADPVTGMAPALSF